MKYGKNYFQEVYMSRSKENASNKFNRHLDFISKYKKTGNLLDMGFAKGDFLKAAEKKGNWKLFGIDVSEYAYNITKNFVKAQLELVNLNKEKIPFPDKFFDVIYASEILEHLNPQNLMLKEIFRCLKPEGFFFLTMPNRPKQKPLKWDLTCGHINLHNKKSILNKFMDTGFNKNKINVRYEGILGVGFIRHIFRKFGLLHNIILSKNDGIFKNKKSLIVFGNK